jgi:hypothetical protein
LHLHAARGGPAVAEGAEGWSARSRGGMATLHFGIDKLIQLEREQPELFR